MQTLEALRTIGQAMREDAQAALESDRFQQGKEKGRLAAQKAKCGFAGVLRKAADALCKEQGR